MQLDDCRRENERHMSRLAALTERYHALTRYLEQLEIEAEHVPWPVRGYVEIHDPTQFAEPLRLELPTLAVANRPWLQQQLEAALSALSYEVRDTWTAIDNVASEAKAICDQAQAIAEQAAGTVPA